jgi:uncharacterized protein (TIGR02569 family)
VSPAPPASVLQAFGIDAPASILAGGQGGAFRAGAWVLKRTDEPDEIAWAGPVLATLPRQGFRCPRYLRSRGGAWTAGGWFAQEHLGGRHEPRRWAEVLEVCAAFHRALAGVPSPAFMTRRTNPWAVADRMAWQEIPLVHGPQVAAFVAALAERLAPVSLPAQVIHGDFTENVLFGPGAEPPAVIDFTPYWRPALFAQAVVVVDAITWRGADVSLLDAIAGPQAHQMLLRAQLRRLLEIDQHFRQSGREAFAQLPPIVPWWTGSSPGLARGVRQRTTQRPPIH